MDKTTKITKENIMEYAVKSVIATVMECTFAILTVTRRPATPETFGSQPNAAPLLRAIEADIKDLETPVLNGLVAKSKVLGRQGKYLEEAMTYDEMQTFIDFARTLNLSLAMLRDVQTTIAFGNELGENAYKRELSPNTRYLNFFEKHPITESKIVALIRFSFVMAYTDALEVVRRAAKTLGYKEPDRLDLESGYIEEVFSSTDLLNSMYRSYNRTEKCTEKATFAGIMTHAVERGVAKYSIIQNAPRHR